MSIGRTSGSAAVWYLVQFKPNGFARARANLHRQGISTFTPLCSGPPLNGKASTPTPLFPGYMFAQFDPLRVPFSTVNSTFGVSRIVTSGCDAQHGISPKLIEGLQARCDEHDHLLPLNDLNVNEAVRITAGPFSRFLAVVDRLKGPERVQILFEVMGQTVRSEIAVNDLERVL